ncbi:NAD(P)/FAD-dependent oxidoreductase [Streptomyces sp. NPDC005811]|uniref:flavin monoamine oxidase family protein n=1 Tax=Streptomyces sp. NPDC005811 TaxID=3154565 RepID=UPI003400723B
MQTLDNGPVIVIGAGLAGLTAARKLRQAGVEVIVLEVGDQVGGRALTTTDGWCAGQYADHGGEIIDRSYHALTTLCGELGVELSQPLAYGRPEPEDLSLVEGYLRVGRFLVDGGVIAQEEAARAAADIRAAAQAHPPQHHEIVEQWVRRSRLSTVPAAAVRSVSRMLTQLDPWDCDVHYIFGTPSADFRRVIGGTQRLAFALAEGLDIRLNQTVARVRRVGGVTVETEDGTTYTGSRVICAAGPFAMLTIGFDPPLPEEKVATAMSLLPAMAGKVLAQYAEGDAVREAFGSIVYTDGAINSAWVGSMHLSEGPAIVAAFINGEGRGVLADEEASLRMVDDLVVKATGGPVTRLHGEVKNWWADPIAKGVTVMPSAAARTTIASVLSAVEHRTHLAGDYTDGPMSGTLEAAVRSGIRAADEILRSPRRYHADLIDERLSRA